MNLTLIFAIGGGLIIGLGSARFWNWADRYFDRQEEDAMNAIYAEKRESNCYDYDLEELAKEKAQ